MAQNLIKRIYWFIVLTICINLGDGHWKKRDEAKLRHDIEVFRKMADIIGQEIEDFYKEYPEERLNVEVNRREKIHSKYVQNTLNRDFMTKNVNKQDETIFQQKYTGSPENNNISPKTLNGNITADKTSFNKFVSFINNNRSRSKWPKFEELLLEMGKKYDWKNDRWIKVKEKLKRKSNEVNVIQHDVDFHERHKFSYRIVKLNRNKRRNVVVAVSAVR